MNPHPRWFRSDGLDGVFSGNHSYFPPEGMNDETTVNITAYVLQVKEAKGEPGR
jgi:hypothetical protein